MAACLGDPDHGYYMRREPFGRGGDFVTAPEVNEIFGELVGARCLATWEAMGSPAPFVFAELGPGRGTLMADILRTARLRPAFVDAARVHLVEMSPRLRGAQRVALTQSAERLAWVDRVDDLPAGPLMLVANEFFDALPIHQFIRMTDGWAERMVGLDEDDRLAFGLLPRSGLPPETAGNRDDLPKTAGIRSPTQAPAAAASLAGEAGKGSAPDTGTVEISPARGAIVHAIAERLAREGGAALVIDYGYVGPAFGNTLQAVRRHEYADPLAAPGEADLTAHVDFAALAAAANQAGACPRPLLTQAEFLFRIGLRERAALLSHGKDEAARAAIAADMERLTGRSAMGELFKVLAISSRGLAMPAFDNTF